MAKEPYKTDHILQKTHILTFHTQPNHISHRFKLRFWFHLNLYRDICVFGIGGFRGCSTFSGPVEFAAPRNVIAQNLGLFCKRALKKRLYSAKETNNLIDPTHRSHPIYIFEYSLNDCQNIVSFIGLFCKRDLNFVL